jgi:hypothetical protein
MGAACGRWRMPGGPHPGTLAATSLHTNNSPNPILALLSGLRPVCMRRKRVAEYS